MKKTSEELIKERAKRVLDAVQLKVPDRVPFMTMFHFYPTNCVGVSCEEAMYDYDKLGMAFKKAILDLEPDMYMNPYPFLALGRLLEILESKELKWPGHGVSPHQTFQFNEAERMKPEEYDDFLFDPTGFVLRTFLPRIYGALEPLQMLPSLPSVYYIRFLTGTAAFAIPEVAGAFDSLLKSGAEARRILGRGHSFAEEMAALGFPVQFGGTAYAPYDYIGDFFRGTRGIMLDINRIPEKLLAAMEKSIPIIVHGAVMSVKTTGVPYIFIPLHKGLDGFMSLEQFKTFFWPQLRKVILALIDGDMTPVVLWEGNCTSRLEIIGDIPRGKAVYWFEQTDIFRAKEVLGDTVCIRGNVPAFLLNAGSPQEVKEYCIKLIDIVGKGGGFIMDGAIGIPDEAKPENVKTMVETTREYGVYG